MVQTEGVTDFLTGDQIAPGSGIVSGRIKIRIVELDSTLSNMAAACPNAGNAEPAIITIGAIAYFHHPGCGRATLFASIMTWNYSGIQYSGLGPVTGGGAKDGVPLTTHVIT